MCLGIFWLGITIKKTSTNLLLGCMLNPSVNTSGHEKGRIGNHSWSQHMNFDSMKRKLGILDEP